MDKVNTKGEFLSLEGLRSKLIYYLNKLVKGLNDEEVQFRLYTTLKILSIPTLFLIIISSFVAVLLKLDLYYFEAHGLIGEVKALEGAFYEYLFNELSDYLPYVAIFFIFLIFMAMYVADMFIRPFRAIGDYCEARSKGEKASYDPEFFADLKLLTQFSDLFFVSIEQMFEKNKMEPFQVPEKYTKIHKPVFEKAFFIQFSLLVFMAVICTSVALFVMGVELNDSMIQLALSTISPTKAMLAFFKKQTEIFTMYIGGGILLHTLLFSFLSLNLYQSVATPAFGIFATMRSFLKGNYSSRVHLIGYSYLRSHCRKLNKYLDYIEKNLVHNQTGKHSTIKDSE